jgi:hypothetical protein
LSFILCSFQILRALLHLRTPEQFGRRTGLLEREESPSSLATLQHLTSNPGCSGKYSLAQLAKPISLWYALHTLATHQNRVSRQAAKHISDLPSRVIASLEMASVNGALSPPSHSESTTTPITHSVKRKRDESDEIQNITNGTADDEEAAQTGESLEEAQSLVRDLIDVLKA